MGGTELPAVQASASRRADGTVTVTAANLSMTEEQTVRLAFTEWKPVSVIGTLLAGEAHQHNTFDAPEAVAEQPLPVRPAEGGVSFTLPACGVVSVQLR